MPLKNHIETSLKINPAPLPLSRMLLCSLITTFPLILGFFKNQLAFAIIGSLMAFSLILNDHFGPIKDRLKHLLISFFFLTLAFFIGAELAGNTWAMASLLLLSSFFLGKSKDKGLELERLVLFFILHLIAASDSSWMKEHFFQLIPYLISSIGFYIFSLLLINFSFADKPESISSKRRIIKKVMTHTQSNKFSAIFSATVTIGFLLAHNLHISRGYWVVGTTLIVMIPDTILSLYKSFQRLLGTFLGVMIAAFILNISHQPIMILLFVFICAFLTPLGLARNYWLGNIFIAALIMFLLGIAQVNYSGSLSLALLRATDIGLGCALAFIGTIINNPQFILRQHNSNI